MTNPDQLSGNSDSIEDLSAVILTEAAARELFGSADVVGRVLTLDGQYDFQVAAVVGNNPSNTHLVSNIYLNVENVPTLWNFPSIWQNLGSDVMYSYVKLVAGSDVDEVQQKSEDFLANELDLGADFVSAVDVIYQPLTDIHFNTDLQNEMSVQDDITGLVKPRRQATDVAVFAGVALLTLVIAIFNYVNLQIVQSYRRSREIAVRRVIGTL